MSSLSSSSVLPSMATAVGTGTALQTTTVTSMSYAATYSPTVCSKISNGITNTFTDRCPTATRILNDSGYSRGCSNGPFSIETPEDSVFIQPLTDRTMKIIDACCNGNAWAYDNDDCEQGAFCRPSGNRSLLELSRCILPDIAPSAFPKGVRSYDCRNGAGGVGDKCYHEGTYVNVNVGDIGDGITFDDGPNAAFSLSKSGAITSVIWSVMAVFGALYL